MCFDSAGVLMSRLPSVSASNCLLLYRNVKEWKHGEHRMVGYKINPFQGSDLPKLNCVCLKTRKIIHGFTSFFLFYQYYFRRGINRDLCTLVVQEGCGLVWEMSI